MPDNLFYRLGLARRVKDTMTSFSVLLSNWVKPFLDNLTSTFVDSDHFYLYCGTSKQNDINLNENWNNKIIK